jgi:hypothetical protein
VEVVPYYPLVTATPNVGVYKNGVLVGTRPNINLIEGSQVSLTVTDDAPNTEVDVTIASTAGGASSAGSILQGVLGTYNEGSLVADFQTSTGNAFNNTTGTVGANTAFYTQVQVNTTITAYQMAWINGATLSGTVDVGIYSDANVRLVSSAPQTQAGVSTVQAFDIADTVLTPGTYFLALASSSATATFRNSNINANVLRACGVYQQAGLTSGTLPNPSVPATMGSATLPVLCVAFQSATF